MIVTLLFSQFLLSPGQSSDALNVANDRTKDLLATYKSDARFDHLVGSPEIWGRLSEFLGFNRASTEGAWMDDYWCNVNRNVSMHSRMICCGKSVAQQIVQNAIEERRLVREISWGLDADPSDYHEETRLVRERAKFARNAFEQSALDMRKAEGKVDSFRDPIVPEDFGEDLPALAAAQAQLEAARQDAARAMENASRRHYETAAANNAAYDAALQFFLDRYARKVVALQSLSAGVSMGELCAMAQVDHLDQELMAQDRLEGMKDILGYVDADAYKWPQADRFFMGLNALKEQILAK